jgi:hypothetical protein
MNHSVPSSSLVDSPINSGMQAVVELFDAELVQLKFPDVDQAVLGEAVARVLSQAETVAAAEAALATAREALSDAQEVLLGKCQRALAYARVYAEEDRELLRKLDAINLPRARGKAAMTGPTDVAEPRAARRGRRTPPASGPLFLDPAGSAPVAEESPGADSCAA